MGYLLNLVIMGGLFSILAISLNIAAGFVNILSLAQAAFYGIGAYTLALLTAKAGFPFWFGLLLGGVAAALCAVLLGFPTLRLHGDYFLIATLGFGEIFYNTLINWDSLTEGPRGITAIPSAAILGLRFSGDLAFLALVVAVLLLCLVTAALVKYSPLGQVLFAIAEDETGVAALGRNPTSFKILAMGLSAFWAGIAGGLLAAYLGYISPNLFTINDSILIFTMVLLGGLRSIRGAVLGAFVLVALPEVMRFLGFPTPIAAFLRQMVYGVVLILIMYLRPQGLLGTVKLR
jgi:branched-chain amino acid transport system permease protein